MRALNDAIIFRPAIANRLKNCKCDRHAKQSNQEETLGEQFENQAGDEDPQYNWEENLHLRTSALIKATCCKEIEFPSHCCEIGKDAPKLIPWKCYTKDEHGE